jgi:hypothetical protein
MIPVNLVKDVFMIRLIVTMKMNVMNIVAIDTRDDNTKQYAAMIKTHVLRMYVTLKVVAGTRIFHMMITMLALMITVIRMMVFPTYLKIVMITMLALKTGVIRT